MKVSLLANKFDFDVETPEGIKTYQLREMNAGDRDQYLDKFNKRVDRDAKGMPLGLNKIEGAQADLLGRTLYDPEGKLVTREVIQSWPSTAVTEIFKKSQLINHLSEEETVEQVQAEVKNA